MKKSFILSSVVSLTLVGVAPSLFAADRNDARIEAREDHRIPYSQVPGEAKRAIEPQLNLNDKVTDAFKYTRGDRTIYVVQTNDERIIRADDKGNLISVKSTDEDNQPANQNNRKAVKFNNLPGSVKNALRKEAGNHPMEVWQVDRNGKTAYLAYYEDNEGTHRIRVNDNGDIVDRPTLLSDRGDERNRNNDYQDSIDARRRQDRDRYNAEGEKLRYDNLPGPIKSAVASEMNRDEKVTDVVRVTRNGKAQYRVEMEGENRARTLWVDENGKLVKDLNDTEEGRVRVAMSELPGPVKSAMINEAHGKEPTKIWQVTRGSDTWYVGEAVDGHMVRIDDNGKVMSHDTHPKLLSDRNDTRDRNARDNANNSNNNNNRNDNVLQRNRDDIATAERNRNRDNNANNDDKKFEKPRDLDKNNDGKIDGEKINWGDLPKEVQRTVMDNVKSGEKAKEIYKVKADSGNHHYVIHTENDRWIRVGENGGLLGQTKK